MYLPLPPALIPETLKIIMVNNMRFKALLLLMLTCLFPVSVFADTYPVIQPSQTQICQSWGLYRVDGEFNGPNWCRYGPALNYSGATKYFYNGTPPNSTSCPGGGTSNGTNCLNAPACGAGSVRNTTTGICPAPTCTLPQVIVGGSCATPPDCNATWPTGGQYYDVTASACATTPPGGMTLCVGANEKFCPPINDCKPASYICTNDPATVAAATTAKTTTITTSKTAADSSVATVQTVSNQVATPVAADNQAKVLAQQNADSAKTALAAVQSNPSATAQQLSDAVAAYSSSLSTLSSASTKLTNATASATQVSTDLATAQQNANAIPTAPTSTHATTAASAAAAAATDAMNALNDAIAGGGS
ncbi:MAG TPA: hypothetical protein VIE65_15810, partial [Methylobacter sp.]